jgi:integrase
LASSDHDDSPHGQNFLEAIKKFGELSCKSKDDRNRDGTTVREASERYRAWLVETGKRTRQYDCSVGKGLPIIGHHTLENLKPFHIHDWLATEKRWNSTSKGIAFRMLKLIFNWNKKRKLTTINPLEGTSIPNEYKILTRGNEFALPDELVAKILETARSKRFKEFLLALSETGARPSEIALARPFNYDPKLQAIVYSGKATKGYIWKNAKKTGKDRVIYLTPPLVEIVERNISLELAFLFPADRGGSYAGQRGITHLNLSIKYKPAFYTYCLSNGFDVKFINQYSFRHSYATRALEKGVPIATLAELMGTSVEMISRCYGHLCVKKDYLRSMANQIAQR